MVAKGQALNVLRVFVADGIEIWAAAAMAHERRRLQAMDGAEYSAVKTGGPGSARDVQQSVVEVEVESVANGRIWLVEQGVRPNVGAQDQHW